MLELKSAAAVWQDSAWHSSDSVAECATTAVSTFAQEASEAVGEMMAIANMT